jgi:hypothetical protein
VIRPWVEDPNNLSDGGSEERHVERSVSSRVYHPRRYRLHVLGRRRGVRRWRGATGSACGQERIDFGRAATHARARRCGDRPFSHGCGHVGQICAAFGVCGSNFPLSKPPNPPKPYPTTSLPILSYLIYLSILSYLILSYLLITSCTALVSFLLHRRPRGRLPVGKKQVRAIGFCDRRALEKPTPFETPTRLAHASTCSHRRPDLQALMEQQLLQTGEEAISKLAGRAAEVQGLVSANFAAKSLADVQASFEAAFASGAPGAVNAEVVKVHTLVREQAAQASQSSGQSALSRSSLCGRPPSTPSGKAPEPDRRALAAWMPTRGCGGLSCKVA